jgi:hypothetical protein
MVTGGAVLAAGIVLLVMNRPYAFVPEVSNSGATLGVAGRF